MKAKLTKDSITIMGKNADVQAFLKRLSEKYGNMKLKDYLEMCNKEMDDPKRLKV